MRKFSIGILAGVPLVMLLAVLSGCNKHREEMTYSEPVYLEPAKPYDVIEDKDKGIKYAVLQQGSVISENINGWNALSPEFFAKLSALTVKVPDEDKTPHTGRAVFVPTIKKSERYPERQSARIYTGSLVPKELHGWVAVDDASQLQLTKLFLETNKK